MDAIGLVNDVGGCGRSDVTSYSGDEFVPSSELSGVGVGGGVGAGLGVGVVVGVGAVGGWVISGVCVGTGAAVVV